MGDSKRERREKGRCDQLLEAGDAVRCWIEFEEADQYDERGNLISGGASLYGRWFLYDGSKQPMQQLRYDMVLYECGCGALTKCTGACPPTSHEVPNYFADRQVGPRVWVRDRVAGKGDLPAPKIKILETGNPLLETE